MLRVIQIIPSLGKGGAERLVLDLCNQLVQSKKAEVLLITFHPNNAYTFLTQNINWKIIPVPGALSISGKSNLDTSKLQQTIDDFQPDVIHSHLFESEVVLSQIQSSARRVVHFHDNMPQFQNFTWRTFINKNKLTNFYEKTLVLKAYKKKPPLLIAISKDSLGYIKKVLPTYASRLEYNAINLQRFQQATTPAQENKLVMTGSLVAKKGQKLAIETINVLRKRGVECSLDLLGDGPLRGELEALVKQIQLERQVHFHGNVDHPEQYLQQAKIYIHTAHEEAFGLVLVEAMAVGLPIVCSDGHGNRDLIVEGENGFLIPQRDPHLLADKIEYLLSNSKEWLQMSEYAKQFAEKYCMTSYVSRILELYKT